MENIGSNLRIENIYFSELSFTREEYIKDSFEINHSIDVEYSDISKNSIKVSIIYNCKAKKQEFEVKAVINGRFELTNYETFDDDTVEAILKINTLAILIPYLRSQVVLLTSQIGMSPIQLPLINAELLYKSSLKRIN